ncbi:NAD(P)H-binding protein [Hirschia litorea]|uniref:NAD(P)H-binding protein n=1 Tax=Hirschia litorea TaxID=1199156 RepID=A0ABW2IIV5_9PROT
MQKQRTALILGATGGIGGAITRALVAKHWHIIALARDIQKASARGPVGVNWVHGDVMNCADVVKAAEGANIIVHAVNPSGYRNWDKLVLPMIDNTIAAAREANGARIVLPGTIYNYDPKLTPILNIDTPQNANSRKGRIRIALEHRLKHASEHTPVLILRAGDFFGPDVGSSWFAQAMIMPNRPVKKITNVAKGSGHSWAYLPDLAETFARLLDIHENLQPFEMLQFEGLYDHSGHELTDAIQRVVGVKLPIKQFPWWLMKTLSPFGGFPREAAELAPSWEYPVKLDNYRLVQLLGQEPRTPLDIAIKRTLESMKCVS